LHRGGRYSRGAAARVGDEEAAMAAMAREAWDASLRTSAAERRRAAALVPVRFRVHAETLFGQRVVGTSHTSGATLFTA